MRFYDLLSMSVNSLLRRKLRTFLTVLGVVIGTASIVVMISLGIGLNNFTMEQYESSGSLTAIRVYNYDRGGSSDKQNPEDSFMTDETMKQFERIPHVVSAYPKINMSVIMKQGIYEGNVQLMGIPLMAMKDIKLGQGTLPSLIHQSLRWWWETWRYRIFTMPKPVRGIMTPENCRMWIL